MMDPLLIPWDYVVTVFWYTVIFVVAFCVGCVCACGFADRSEEITDPIVYLPFMFGFFAVWAIAAWIAGYIVFV